MDDGAITALKTSGSLSFLRKAEEDSDSLSVCGKAFQNLGGVEESPEAELLFGTYGFHPHLEYKGRLRK